MDLAYAKKQKKEVVKRQDVLYGKVSNTYATLPALFNLLCSFFCKNAFVCVLVSACLHTCVHVSGLHVEVRVQLGRVSSLYHTGHRDPIQVIRLSSKHLCPLSHLTVLFCLFCFLS